MSEYHIKLPFYTFLQDCYDCDCDIGEWENGTLTATQAQLDELVDRAQFYADPWGPNLEDRPGLRPSARALLKRLPRKGVTRPPFYVTPLRVLDRCIIQPIADDDPHLGYRWVCIAPEGHHVAGYGATYKNTASLKEAETVARQGIEKGEPR